MAGIRTGLKSTVVPESPVVVDGAVPPPEIRFPGCAAPPVPLFPAVILSVMTEPVPRPFLSVKVNWEGMLEAALLVGLAGSLLGLLGRWHWLADLFCHFRWQALVVCVVAVPWSLWRHRRVLSGVSLLTLGLHGWLLVRVGSPAPSGMAAADFKVRVVSLNVLTSNQDHAAVLSFLQQADADVIFLMEVDVVWEQALQPLLRTHPHHVVQPQSDNFG